MQASDDEDVNEDESQLQESPGGRLASPPFATTLPYLKRWPYSMSKSPLVSLPTERAIDPRVTPRGNSDAPLAPYDQAFTTMKPMDFYQQGVAVPFQTKQGPDGGDLEGELRRNRVHIVIVPGIFGEFIPVSPFEEVFGKS